MADKNTNNEIIDRNRSYYADAAKSYYVEDDSRVLTKRHLEYVYSVAIDKSCPEKVLDIGTGTGFAIDIMNGAMRGKGVRFIGCDVSMQMLTASKERAVNADLILFDGERLPFPDDAFDMVVLSSVLHHIYDPMPLLKEALRVLVGGGVIIISQEPNPIVNAYLLKLRRLLRLMPDESVMMAEYHQFMTDGIDPKPIVDLLKGHDLDCVLYYSNGPLIDEVAMRLGGWSRGALFLLALAKTRFTGQSYSIVGKGKVS